MNNLEIQFWNRHEIIKDSLERKELL